MVSLPVCHAYPPTPRYEGTIERKTSDRFKGDRQHVVIRGGPTGASLTVSCFMWIIIEKSLSHSSAGVIGVWKLFQGNARNEVVKYFFTWSSSISLLSSLTFIAFTRAPSFCALAKAFAATSSPLSWRPAPCIHFSRNASCFRFFFQVNSVYVLWEGGWVLPLEIVHFS